MAVTDNEEFVTYGRKAVEHLTADDEYDVRRQYAVDILYKTIGTMFVDNIIKQKRFEDHEEQLKQNAKVIEFAAKMSKFVDDIVVGNIKDFDTAYMKAYDLHQEELKLLGKEE